MPLKKQHEHGRNPRPLGRGGCQGVLRPMYNSEGRLIHPEPWGIENFWRWFGDSKAVDDHGRPLVLYHGTNRDFDVFEKSLCGLMGAGIYLTNHRGRAGLYSSIRMVELYVRIEAPWEIQPKDSPLLDHHGEFSGLRSPIIHEIMSLKDGSSLISETTKDEELAGFGFFDYRLTSRLLELGCDGIAAIYGDKESVIDFVAFNPHQIKSATNNSGAFNPRSPGITDKNLVLNRLTTRR